MAQAFSSFREDPDVVIFASGVSNSLETDPAAFDREKTLLQRARSEYEDKLLVYFGTCSVDDPDRKNSLYVHHKLEMEAILARSDARWMVLRLPLAIGKGHRGPTLAQYLYERISRREQFEVWAGATRYPIDVDDVCRIAQRLLADSTMTNRVINIAFGAYKVLDFVHSMEKISGKRANFTMVHHKGRHYDIRCPEVENIADELKIDRRKDYLEKTLRKYFGRSGSS